MVSRPGAPGPSSILSEKSSRMSSRPMSSGGRAPAVGLNGLGIGSPLDSFILFILLSLAVTISSCAVTPRPLPRCGDSTDRSPNTACTPSALILSRLVLSCLRERPAQHNPRHCLWRHPWGPRDSDDEHAGSIVDQSPIQVGIAAELYLDRRGPAWATVARALGNPDKEPSQDVMS